MATPPSTVRQRPAYSSRPTSPTLESPDIPHPRPPPLGLSASKDLPKVGHKSPAVPSQSIPPSPSHIPPPPKSSLLGLAQLPILLLTAVVLVPSFIELASRYSNIYQAAPLAGARAVLPKAWEKDAGIVGEQGGNGGYGGIGDPGRERERRQTIADMSVPVDEYKWGGEGNGTEICKRWSHQSALVSDTLYIFGGQATTNADQKTSRWNSNFVSISLKQSWDIASPPAEAVSQDGPPPVANAYLFSSTTGDSPVLYLYGGLFSDTPPVLPPENSVWAYSVNDKKWTEIKKDNFVITDDSEQKYIDRAAEGAGVSIPERGLGFYFGGHLDGYTTQGWDQSIPRIYLKSMVELRFPGGTEGEIDNGQVGFRNVSEGSGLDKAGVPERADGVLVFVPWGPEGLLVGIGGGRSETFSQLNIVDIYDLSTSTWFRQATSGPTPKYRVNPCAVVASAPDGSSHNIYLYGGQNLVPYKEQIQYDDMWILSIPSFTWIEVPLDGKTNPYARAGHTCEAWGRQMVVVGGFVDEKLSCDSPGIHVFDMTNLLWKNEFIGTESKGTGNSDSGEGEDGGSGGSGGPSQLIDLTYRVPPLVRKVVGGDENGGATITKPVRTPDPDSPLITGNPTYTYDRPGYTMTITREDGSIVTETGVGFGGNPDGGSGGGGPNIGMIVGAIVGGLVGFIILLLGGLFILYKRKIRTLREKSRTTWESNVQRNIRANQRRPSTGGTSTAAGGGGRWSGSEGRRSTDELLMDGHEPSFWGMVMAPRRSLRVVNLS